MKIDRILFKIGTACTLRCKKCGEFNPYLHEKGKKKFYDADLLCKDIDKLGDVAEEIEVIQLSGGECLLHPQIGKILKHIGENPKFKHICIFSNGTYIPKKETLEIMLSLGDRFNLDISNYTVVGIDSMKAPKIYDSYGIKYNMIDMSYWIDHTNISYKNLDTEQLKDLAKECWAYNTGTVMYSVIEGKVTSHCCTAASIMYYLDLYKDMPSSYVDLRNNIDNLEKELERLFEVDYMPVCNYCISESKKEHIPVAEQIARVETSKKGFSLRKIFSCIKK